MSSVTEIKAQRLQVLYEEKARLQDKFTTEMARWTENEESLSHVLKGQMCHSFLSKEQYLLDIRGRISESSARANECKARLISLESEIALIVEELLDLQKRSSQERIELLKLQIELEKIKRDHPG